MDGVVKANGGGNIASATQDDLPSGTSNFAFNTGEMAAHFTTDNLPEGSTNKYVSAAGLQAMGGLASDQYDDGTDTTISISNGLVWNIATAYDERLMKDIVYMATINPSNQLIPINFKWNTIGLKQFKNAISKSGIQIGYKAQDVQKFYPSCIVTKQMNLTGSITDYIQYDRNCIDVMMALKLQEKDNLINNMQTEMCLKDLNKWSWCK